LTVGFDTPEDVRYTEEHEWIRDEGDGTARIGITDFAQDQLTDVVYVDLPFEDEEFDQGDAMMVVESVKSVSDVYAPVDCTVLEINDELEASPEIVNEDPYGDGWMALVELADASQLDDLMDDEAYREFTLNEA
jgi:glycine cleavage system H protein